MALPPTGSDKLLEIRTEYIDIVIKSKGKQNAGFLQKDAGISSLKVVARNLERISIPTQEVFEDYRDHKGLSVHDYRVAPLFFEQTDYIVTIQARSGEALEFHSNSSLVDERVSRVLDDNPSLLSGVINYGNSVGFSDLVIVANGREVLTVRLEVYPTKISYKEDYREMMDDINNMVSESVLDFMKKTYQVFVPNHQRNNVPAVFFTVLQTIYDKYLQSAKRILAVPHHKLGTEYEVLPHYKATRTDLRSERWLQKHPEQVRRSDAGIQAEKVLSVRKQITYDTQENRLVKYMLKSTMRRIDDFRRRYISERQQPDEKIVSGATKMSRDLQRLLGTSWLSNVSEYSASKSMSLVFGMAPGYRELYKYYLMLQNGITVGGDVFHMSVRDTAQLYEYWCFIKLYDILRSHYTLKSPDIIKVDRKGVTIDLAKGQPSRVTFLNTKTGERIYLAYNPKEIATQTVSQRPDNVLELEKKGSGSAYKYVFDAKYRIETNPDGNYYPDSKPGPKVDDINTMHRYRDSIVYENPESKFTFEKTMFGAYILFPYANEDEYKKHKFYKSIDSVNIGGLPFLPSATSLVTELLDELVSDSPEAAFERASLPAGIEERLKSVDWSKREVLIGFVQDETHRKWFLDNNMYFTPRFDTENLPVRYVALYEREIGIRYYGEVIGWEQVPRHALPGRSAHNKVKYHKFKVLKWKTLDTTISVLEHGPNPISYTNYFLLSHSSSYSELLLRNEEDYRFFTEIKRRRNETVIKQNDEATAFEFGSSKVLLDKSHICVFVGDKPVELCSLQEFSKQPNSMFRRIQKYSELITTFKSLEGDIVGQKETSKFISLILRHKPETIGITLDEHGWADVQDMILGINAFGNHHLDKEMLEEIVRTDEKQRYSFNEDHTLIRANQGHSIPVDVELEKKTPPAVLYHGTGEKYTASIDEQGLIRKSRLYVHLTSDPETAKKVGRRHGKPVIYMVDCAAMTADGYTFYLSANNVWLTKEVPAKYLHKMEMK